MKLKETIDNPLRLDKGQGTNTGTKNTTGVFPATGTGALRLKFKKGCAQ